MANARLIAGVGTVTDHPLLLASLGPFNDGDPLLAANKCAAQNADSLTLGPLIYEERIKTVRGGMQDFEVPIRVPVHRVTQGPVVPRPAWQRNNDILVTVGSGIGVGSFSTVANSTLPEIIGPGTLRPGANHDSIARPWVARSVCLGMILNAEAQNGDFRPATERDP
ncbi:MAG: hypothetical protein ACT4PL_05705 [Phycisphaerales bacterium]